MGKIQQILCCLGIHKPLTTFDPQTCDIFQIRRHIKHKITSENNNSHHSSIAVMNTTNALRLTNEQLKLLLLSLASLGL
jgi:hypothetical protein